MGEGNKVDLGKWPTNVEPVCNSRKHYKDLLAKHVEKLSALQQLHYASNRYAVLLIFQAMNAAGKDGAIRHVMSGVNPQGCQVFSFKHPSATELLHDFLWRTTRDLPERGRIGIFNRSYYEEVLIARVHPKILRNEGLPDSLRFETAVWQDRYRSILDLEAHLHRNGTRIIKFYLHLSKDGAAKALPRPHRRARKELEIQHGGHQGAEVLEALYDGLRGMRQRDKYYRCPWYVVPADDKDNARLIVSQIILDTLEGLDMSYPKQPLSATRNCFRSVNNSPLENTDFTSVRDSRPRSSSCQGGEALRNAPFGLIDERSAQWQVASCRK